MPIQYHPEPGAIVLCDFTDGFKPPEMCKLRPVVILSRKISNKHNLCTVVSLSTSEPLSIMPYHKKIDLPKGIPERYLRKPTWVKGDMINAVGFHRLDLIRLGKNDKGKRKYFTKTLDKKNYQLVQKCVLQAMGMSHLNKHL